MSKILYFGTDNFPDWNTVVNYLLKSIGKL